MEPASNRTTNKKCPRHFSRRKLIKQLHLVEHLQLVNAVVSHQGLANKQHQLRLVLVDELTQGSHQRLVVLPAQDNTSTRVPRRG